MPWYEKEDLEKARVMTAIEYLKRYEPQRLKLKCYNKVVTEVANKI